MLGICVFAFASEKGGFSTTFTRGIQRMADCNYGVWSIDLPQGKRGKRKARLGHCINAKDWHICVGYLACMLGGILQRQETTEWSRKNRGGEKLRQASIQKRSSRDVLPLYSNGDGEPRDTSYMTS